MRREGEGKVGKRGRGGTDPISEITLVSAGASPDVVVVSEETGPLTSGVAFRILGQLEFVDDNLAKAAVCFHFTSDRPTETWTNQKTHSRNSQFASPVAAACGCAVRCDAVCREFWTLNFR